jgi:hypothetical protein
VGGGKLCYVGMLCLLLCCGRSGAASAATLRADRDNERNPLEIHGTLDGSKTSFSGYIGLTLLAEGSAKLVLKRPDLEAQSDPARRIDRVNVGLQDTTLKKGVPQDVMVTVNNVTYPGEYTGILEFRTDSQPEADPLRVTLKLKVTARPSVTPLVANPAYRTVACRTPCLDSWLRSIPLLFPSSLQNDSHYVLFANNKPEANPQVERAELTMCGDKTAHQVPATVRWIVPPKKASVSPKRANPGDDASALLVQIPHRMATGQEGAITLTVDPKQLPADHYQGTLRLYLSGAGEPVLENLTLDVREGPFWALVMVFLGIAVGRLALMMAEAQPQMKQMERWSRLMRRKETEVQNGNSRNFLDHRLQTVYGLIDSGPVERADADLALLDTQISFLADLEYLEERLEAPEWANERANLLEQLKAARNSFTNDDPAGAEEKRKAVLKAMSQPALDAVTSQLQSLSNRGTLTENLSLAYSSVLDGKGTAKARLGRAVKAISRASSDEETAGLLTRLVDTSEGLAPRGTPPANVGPLRRKAGNVMRWLVHMERVTADTKFIIIRPLLAFILFGLLVLIGFENFYVSSGATFGAGGMADYLALVLWGLTAEVAQSTLQRLPVLK